jgi:hypothetical protein
MAPPAVIHHTSGDIIMADESLATIVLDELEPDAGSPTPTVQVKPLHYTQLRLLAECAVGVVDEPVEFFFREGESLQIGRPEQEMRPKDVLVPALDTGRYPSNSVTLQVDGPHDPRRPPNVPAGIANAVFWSDAAVQKFLFPYISSCAGSRASKVLDDVQSAWNYYPSNVEVYALVHVNRFAPDAVLELDRCIHVAYVEIDGDRRTGLRMAALADFIVDYPSSGARPKAEDLATVDYYRGVDTRRPQTLNYQTLRALAEWACSIRDETQYFVFRKGKHGVGRPHLNPPTVYPGDIVVPALTPTVPANRPSLHGVWLQPDGSADQSDMAKNGDALFWSTGAIEQFLFPYYASKGGFQSLPDLADLVTVWTGRQPQLGTRARRGGNAAFDVADEPAGDEPTGDQVAALIHLHTSEWTEVTVEGQIEEDPMDHVDLRRQLGVVTTDIAGNTRVHRLDRFMAARHPRPDR